MNSKMALILCAQYHKKTDRFLIGNAQNQLLFPGLKMDLKHFREKRRGKILIMGRKTYDSIASLCNTWQDCQLVVLTNQDNLIKEEAWEHKSGEPIFRKNLKDWPFWEKSLLIGGAMLTQSVMQSDLRNHIRDIYLTLVEEPKAQDIEKCISIQAENILEPYRYLGNWKESLEAYELVDFSEKDANCRILHYQQKPQQESPYHHWMRKILLKGEARVDRTKVGTRSLFGTRMEFSLRGGSLPLMTTRRIPFQSIVEELLWFLRGETHTRSLEEKGVKIWSGNSSREFLDARGLTHYQEGEVGPIYGWQWRRFGASYPEGKGGIDQLNQVLHLLKSDPYSRRILMTAWNPTQLEEMALPPCHMQVQFYVHNRNQLSCQFYMRSSDSLAWSFNMVSYSILTHLLAKKAGLEADRIIYVAGDCHIYESHVAAVQQQLTRKERPFPKLALHPDVLHKDWHELQFSDVELIGYFPHPPISMEMAI